jgi:hypothetical protein
VATLYIVPGLVTVGDDVFEVNKISLVAPWVLLIALVITGRAVFLLRKAYS